MCQQHPGMGTSCIRRPRPGSTHAAVYDETGPCDRRLARVRTLVRGARAPAHPDGRRPGSLGQQHPGCETCIRRLGLARRTRLRLRRGQGPPRDRRLARVRTLVRASTCASRRGTTTWARSLPHPVTQDLPAARGFQGLARRRGKYDVYRATSRSVSGSSQTGTRSMGTCASAK